MGNVFDELYKSNKRDQLLADMLNKPPVEDASYIATPDGNEDDTLVDEDELATSFPRPSTAPAQDIKNQICSNGISPALETAYTRPVYTTQPRATLPLPRRAQLPQGPHMPNTESRPVVGPVHAPIAVDRPRVTLPLPQRAPGVFTRQAVQPPLAQSMLVSRDRDISLPPQILKRNLKEEQTSDVSECVVKSKPSHAVPVQILQNEELAGFIMSLPDRPVLCPGQHLFVRETLTGFKHFVVSISIPGVEPPVIPGFVRVLGEDAVEKLKWLRSHLSVSLTNQLKLAATKKKDERSQGPKNVSASMVTPRAPVMTSPGPIVTAPTQGRLFHLLDALPVAGVLYPVMIDGKPSWSKSDTDLVKVALAAYLEENPIVPPTNKENYTPDDDANET